MFSLPVNNDYQLALADLSFAAEVVELTSRNIDRLRRWEQWASVEPTVELTTASLEQVRAEYARGARIPTYIQHRETGALIGSVGMHLAPSRQTASLGYWIDRDHEGHGIAGAAARALITATFAVGEVHRVAASTAVDNTRSRALLERLGFSFEGIARESVPVGDRYDDDAMYAMLASEWDGDTWQVAARHE